MKIDRYSLYAGRNNRSLALNETSVSASEWELFALNGSHYCFYGATKTFLARSQQDIPVLHVIVYRLSLLTLCIRWEVNSTQSHLSPTPCTHRHIST